MFFLVLNPQLLIVIDWKSYSKIYSLISKPYTTNYLSIKYKIHDLNINYEDEFDKNISSLINPKPNDYISKYNSKINLDYDEFDSKNYFLLEYERVSNISDKNLKVFFKKDTSFHLPKIYVNLYFFHPFLRPNFNDSGANNDTYFKYLLFFAYVKRQIREKLADAFRAGENNFKIEINEHLVELDLFIFSDKAKQALSVIKDIINDENGFILLLEKLYKRIKRKI